MNGGVKSDEGEDNECHKQAGLLRKFNNLRIYIPKDPGHHLPNLNSPLRSD